jgi:hypothetical protein
MKAPQPFCVRHVCDLARRPSPLPQKLNEGRTSMIEPGIVAARRSASFRVWADEKNEECSVGCWKNLAGAGRPAFW